MISREDFFFSPSPLNTPLGFSKYFQSFWLPQKSYLYSKERHVQIPVTKPQCKAHIAPFQAPFKIMLHLDSIG